MVFWPSHTLFWCLSSTIIISRQATGRLASMWEAGCSSRAGSLWAGVRHPACELFLACAGTRASWPEQYGGDVFMCADCLTYSCFALYFQPAPVCCVNKSLLKWNLKMDHEHLIMMFCLEPAECMDKDRKLCHWRVNAPINKKSAYSDLLIDTI